MANGNSNNWGQPPADPASYGPPNAGPQQQQQYGQPQQYAQPGPQGQQAPQGEAPQGEATQGAPPPQQQPHGQPGQQPYGQPGQQPYGQPGQPVAQPVYGSVTPAPMRAAVMPAGGGRSRAFPMVVAAGLAVGVFAGLLIVGVGKKSDAKSDDKQEASATDDKGDKQDKNDKAATATVDAGVALVKSAAADAAPKVVKAPVDAAPPEPKKVTLTFTVAPDEAKKYSISVNKKKIDGDTYEIELGKNAKAKVAIVVRARGYFNWYKRREITEDTTIEVKLRKWVKPTVKPGGGPGGLIDLP